MALVVEDINSGFGAESLETQLLQILSDYGLSLSDVYVLPYGDHHTIGMLLIFTE